MKKVIPIFFAALLIFNYVGLMLFYLGEMEACKMEAMKYIDLRTTSLNKELVVFKSSNSDFQLLNDNEILQNNKLFDIVRMEKVNGATIYYAISDDKEDAFWDQVSQLAKNNTDNHQLPGKSSMPDVLKYVSRDYYTNANNSVGLQHNKFNYVVIESFLYQSPFGDIFSPPPQEIFS